MAANYVLLEKITVGAATASSVTFSGIPQTGYTDLVVKASIRNTANVDWTGVYFNGTTTGYSNRAIQGTGAAVTSRNSTDKDLTLLTDENAFTASTFGNAEVYIPNYTSANYKSYSVDTVTENNAATAYMELSAHLWSNTAAITSITLNAQSNALAQYSTFYLYGVAALGTTPVIVPYATGGDTIMTDGTYWYHAFVSSGTFTPAKGLSCDVVVVAGGGGGGTEADANSTGGGGGGAGGLYYSTGNSVASAQTVTVGGGGASGINAGQQGSQGSNSVFGSLTAGVGGGYGGGTDSGTYTRIGGNGGSGGGGGSNGASGTGTAGQGNNAGTVSNLNGAGGGGAGAVGGNASSTNGGNGGAGVNTYSTWLSATGLGVSGYIAGGGGGGYTVVTGGTTNGTGGSGGGGAGGNPAVAGTANTGGGGGGANNLGTNTQGGAGGSGLIIVRYAV